MKIGIQLYSLRREIILDHDTEHVLAELKKMGYDGVEWFDITSEIPAEKLIEMTKAAGLELFSMHTDINGITKCDENYVKLLAEAGVKYMPIGWLPEDRIAGGENFGDTVEKIKKFSKITNKYGIKLLYHNHDFDLEKLPCGTPKLDVLYKELTSDELSCELDTCWLYSGGVDTVEYVKKYDDRTPILHMKDCVKEGGRHGFMPVGSGVLNFSEIVNASSADWYCVEQDEPNDGLDDYACAKASIDYLRKNFN